MQDLINCCTLLAQIESIPPPPLTRFPSTSSSSLPPSFCLSSSPFSWAGTYLSREIMLIDMTIGCMLKHSCSLSSVLDFQPLLGVRGQAATPSLDVLPTFPLPGCPGVPFQMLRFLSLYITSHISSIHCLQQHDKSDLCHHCHSSTVFYTYNGHERIRSPRANHYLK